MTEEFKNRRQRAFSNVSFPNGESTDEQDTRTNAGLENIKNTLEFTRAQRKFNDLDSKYYNLKKLNRVSPGFTDNKELEKMSMELGNAAFDLNQADMARGGDGDFASYDDVGQEGFEQVVKRQETLQQINKKKQ